MAPMLRRCWAGASIVFVGCTSLNPLFQPGDASDSAGSEATSASSTLAPATSDPASTDSASTDSATTRPSTGEPATTGSATTDVATTGVDTDVPVTSTTDPTNTTDVPPACGNGVIDPGEVCDDGPEPPLEPGACLPDCSGKIATRRIFITPESLTGGFASGSDLTLADDICTEYAAGLALVGTYKAMASDGARVASQAPYDGNCSPDWPIQRYTAYVNLEGKLVWVTGKLRLLGVAAIAPNQPATPQPLLHPIHNESRGVWTGLTSTWQTANTCMKWHGGQTLGTVGDAAKQQGFLDSMGDQVCAADYHLFCVEQ